MNTKKYLPINVYKSGTGDCSMDGISHRYTILYLEHTEGFITLTPEEQLEHPIVRYRQKTMNFSGKSIAYSYLEVVNDPIRPEVNADGRWMMFGGNFGYSCDTRFRELCGDARKIHDRHEP